VWKSIFGRTDSSTEVPHLGLIIFHSIGVSPEPLIPLPRTAQCDLGRRIVFEEAVQSPGGATP
jgi:hypothetical protein